MDKNTELLLIIMESESKLTRDILTLSHRIDKIESLLKTLAEQILILKEDTK